MMHKTMFFLIFIFILFSFVVNVNPKTEEQKLNKLKIEQLGKDIDRIDNKISNLEKNIDRKAIKTSKKFSDHFKSINGIKKSLDKILQQIEEIEKIDYRLKEFEASKDKISDSIIRLTERMDNIIRQQGDLKGNIISTGDTVKYVSGIVSLLIIIIGLFFAKKFIDLHKQNASMQVHIDYLREQNKSARK